MRAGLALLMFVTGCASAPALEAAGPRLTYVVDRPIETVRDCLYEQLSHRKVLGFTDPPPTVSPVKGGYVLNWPVTATVVFVRVEPAPEGTRVQVFAKGNMGDLERLVLACR